MRMTSRYLSRMPSRNLPRLHSHLSGKSGMMASNLSLYTLVTATHRYGIHVLPSVFFQHSSPKPMLNIGSGLFVAHALTLHFVGHQTLPLVLALPLPTTRVSTFIHSAFRGRWCPNNTSCSRNPFFVRSFS